MSFSAILERVIIRNMDDNVVKGEIVEAEKTARENRLVLKNGRIAELNAENRLLLTPEFDPVVHAQWLQKRRHLAMLAASKGMTRAAGGKVDDYDAWALIIEAQAELAVQTDQGAVSTRAAEFVGKATGMIDPSSKAVSSEPAVIKADTVNIGSMTLIEKLLNVLDR